MGERVAPRTGRLLFQILLRTWLGLGTHRLYKAPGGIQAQNVSS